MVDVVRPWRLIFQNQQTKIGGLLRHVRYALGRGNDTKQVACEVGVATTTIREIERGVSTTYPAGVLYSLLHLYGISWGYLDHESPATVALAKSDTHLLLHLWARLDTYHDVLGQHGILQALESRVALMEGRPAKPLPSGRESRSRIRAYA